MEGIRLHLTCICLTARLFRMTLLTAHSPYRIRDVTQCSPHIHCTEFVTSHNEQKESFQQYFYNRYKNVVYTGLRSDSIKNHASGNEARLLTCIYLTAAHIHGTILLFYFLHNPTLHVTSYHVKTWEDTRDWYSRGVANIGLDVTSRRLNTVRKVTSRFALCTPAIRHIHVKNKK
jgi:hypothetical protein